MAGEEASRTASSGSAGSGGSIGSGVVVESWDAISRSYRDYWTPRFRPFLERAVSAFEPPPRGPIAVPGSGPGDEVHLLLRKFPGRAIFATDPSPEMVALCRESLRAAGASTALVTLGHAEDLSSLIHQAAGVLSCFTLQLLASPAAALEDWSSALRLGGAVSAIFWPKPMPESSFGLLMKALEDVTQQSRPDWEEPTIASLPHAGLELTLDERVTRPMEHASPEALFDAIVERGALQVLLRRLGREVFAKVRERWLARHGLEKTSSGWRDAAQARLWVLKKISEPGAQSH